MTHQFMFATGIENSYPTIKLPDGSAKRVDELEKTDFYNRWREDFVLVKELGIEYLRYGVPFYKTHLAPDKYDWSFADETFGELQKLGIVPVADLCHFGVPDWIENFQNPDFPELFAAYARAFAEGYRWVRFYTPVNEMYIAATFSAQIGWWNERLASDAAFVTGAALGTQSAANNLGQAAGPLLGGLLFAWRADAPYLLTGALLLVVVGIVAARKAFLGAKA